MAHFAQHPFNIPLSLPAELLPTASAASSSSSHLVHGQHHPQQQQQQQLLSSASHPSAPLVPTTVDHHPFHDFHAHGLPALDVGGAFVDAADFDFTPVMQSSMRMPSAMGLSYSMPPVALAAEMGQTRQQQQQHEPSPPQQQPQPCPETDAAANELLGEASGRRSPDATKRKEQNRNAYVLKGARLIYVYSLIAY
jgi:hypothetical protein